MNKTEKVGELSVSRETIAKLEGYQSHLEKWNRRINLVAKSTLADTWSRHIVDSAACFKICQRYPGEWLDIGSGAGLPGVVLAAIAQEQSEEVSVVCVESDSRKCEFIRSAGRAIDVKVDVITERIEDVPAREASVITSRALSDLTTLLIYAELHLREGGIAVFLKGANWQEEVDRALETWRFKFKNHPSWTNPDATILEIQDISRA